jgi:hypothetical protein
MKVLAFIVAATIFEAVGDAVMRIALHYHAMLGRLALFAVAIVLLALYFVLIRGRTEPRRRTRTPDQGPRE